MLSLHSLLGTWKHKVSRYIALTEFARSKFIEGGVPAKKISVKPNFIYPDPGFTSDRSRHALFVGRLSPEKGLETMLEAWKKVGGKVPLRIVGDGPMAEQVRSGARAIPGVQWLGTLSHDAVLNEMKAAGMLIFPSIWYEGLPLSVLEGFATGLPVIASDLGSLSEIVSEKRTGLLFKAGSSEELAERVLWADSHRGEMRAMYFEARQEFERKYTRERNYEVLMQCYAASIHKAAVWSEELVSTTAGTD